MNWNVGTGEDACYESMKSVWNWFVWDKKLISYDCGPIICIKNSYLKLKYILRIIIISYLKPYSCLCYIIKEWFFI